MDQEPQEDNTNNEIQEMSTSLSDLRLADVEHVIDEGDILASLQHQEQAGITKLPDVLLYKIYNLLSIEDIKSCRVTCRQLNDSIIASDQLTRDSHFIFDGRHDDVQGTKCQTYFGNSSTSMPDHKGCSLWTELCLRRAYAKQLTWIQLQFTSTITTLVFQNCSINWHHVLLILKEFENLTTYSDTLDMYFWDYATFAEGIKDDEEIVGNTFFQEIQAGEGYGHLVSTLQNLKHIQVHRSQLKNCVLYLKIFLLHCTQLESLEITCDQRTSPGPGPWTQFYFRLGQLIQTNVENLNSLCFPYKSEYQTSEFRVFDEHNPFDRFLTYITDHDWATSIQPLCLSTLKIQFQCIRIDETGFQQKLLPFLAAWTTRPKFTNLGLGHVYMEPGKEHVLVDCIPEGIERKNFGVWLLDTVGLPFIEHILQHLTHINIQLSMQLTTELKHILMLDDIDDDEDFIGHGHGSSLSPPIPKYAHVQELQFFNKAINFKTFNLQLLLQHFSTLTHLNLVDFNTRVDRIHSSESPATIEDEDIQKIFGCLPQLELLQLMGNMTFVTDAGMTGIKPEACKRMLKRNVFEKSTQDVIGRSFSSLRKLRTLVLRGVGIKITDVSAYFAFNQMPMLKKLHMTGAHQITNTGKDFMNHMFPTSRNCLLQI